MHRAVRPSLLTAIALGSLLVGAFVDFDGDGLATIGELQLNTGILRSDTDSDGLTDYAEWRLGSPRRDADWDDDGVLDGAEQARVCLVRRDCDGDGLADVDEVDGFSPLDPDSFDTGLDDGLSAVLDELGLPASADTDRDGIPDGWEGDNDVIDWGPFDPAAGRRDLFVEFVHVAGPSSGRFDLDFTAAYDAVVAFFATDGIEMQWHETRIDTVAEVRPDFLTEDTIGYYADTITRSTAWRNPYVTTVVLNPQQTQPDLAGDILGAAFLRSMIVTVDYGTHTIVRFTEAAAEGITLSDGEVLLEPSIESHILDARRDQVRLLRFADEGIIDIGVHSDGDLYLVSRQSGTEFTWTWTPDWFAAAPNITTDDGAYMQLQATGAAVDAPALAATIAHELGHTFGLCHTHEAPCAGLLPRDEFVDRHESTMSYLSPADRLYFLPSEWDQAGEYLTCPPHAPLVVIAADGDDAQFYDAKYLRNFQQLNDVRSCTEAPTITGDLEGRFPTGGLDGLHGALLWSGITAVAIVITVWATRARPPPPEPPAPEPQWIDPLPVWSAQPAPEGLPESGESGERGG